MRGRRRDKPRSQQDVIDELTTMTMQAQVRIEELRRLADKGRLTEPEYAARRQQIIDETEAAASVIRQRFESQA